ncbi:hypothetical protein POSPLADRAFT_1053421 [Postia placenta MAD-698-R-SB12]|uniref:Uncharacterized protein n=1 Tax=Postia placenta MAD-698-R-SB12 TaxID=670580 RepID=A0A1X6N7M1_9APHY|nr:hypothetical protein POSPLADRAFT_1053421 [Postia placenta MAD-698-R-SB12]OSX64611.1 hypothetical protein POSPLADRAFT_1053421 [Postia placenta MAD-698-R-SB12]
MAPELQKRFAALTRTRKEVMVQSIKLQEEEVVKSEEEEDKQDRSDELGTAMVAYSTAEELYGLLERYAGAVAVGSRRYYAMACGVLEGKFGSEQVTFLINSGSELNLITRRVWEQSGVDMDSDGSRWSLKGINGDPVPLLGDRADEPIKLKILGSTHQRNSDKLIMEDPAKQRVTSSVEEVSDEGF